MVKRLNHGKHEGVEETTINNWRVSLVGEDENGVKYKVAAIEPVAGTANYGFYVNKGRISARASQRLQEMQKDRPGLYSTLVDYFYEKYNALHGAPVPDSESDPYGDLVIRRGKRPDKNQEWRRQLLMFRRQELERLAIAPDRVSAWEPGLRALHAALYNEKISSEKLQQSLRYVTQHTVPIDINSLLEIERAYYSGKFKQHSCTRLEEELNNLANNSTGYENLEVENGRPDASDVGSGRGGNDDQEISAAAESPRPEEIDYSIFD